MHGPNDYSFNEKTRTLEHGLGAEEPSDKMKEAAARGDVERLQVERQLERAKAEIKREAGELEQRSKAMAEKGAELDDREKAIDDEIARRLQERKDDIDAEVDRRVAERLAAQRSAAAESVKSSDERPRVDATDRGSSTQ